MDGSHFENGSMPDDERMDKADGREGLDEESVRIFEESYERYREAMERLAEL